MHSAKAQTVEEQIRMKNEQTLKMGNEMLRKKKESADLDLQRVQNMFLNDFFNEKSEKKKEKLTVA